MKLIIAMTPLLFWLGCAAKQRTEKDEQLPNSPKLVQSVPIPGLEGRSVYGVSRLENNHLLFNAAHEEFLLVEMTDPLKPKLVERFSPKRLAVDFNWEHNRVFLTATNHLVKFSR